MGRGWFPATYSVQKSKSQLMDSVGSGVLEGVHILSVVCWRQTPVTRG